MIVVDTHVLVWLDTADARLGANCLSQLDAALAEDELAVSAISFWEVAMLVGKGRIQLDGTVETWRVDLLGAGLRELPVDGAVGIAAAATVDLHGDPADRIIAATATIFRATLATADRALLGWRSTLRRLDART